nr:uncharacterized protein LOC113805526 [Penaeus vannamei]
MLEEICEMRGLETNFYFAGIFSRMCWESWRKFLGRRQPRPAVTSPRCDGLLKGRPSSSRTQVFVHRLYTAKQHRRHEVHADPVRPGRLRRRLPGVPGPVAVRAPSHDSAIIQSHRLGGNFAYSTHEAHAYAVQTPVIAQRTVPVGVSYHHGAPIVKTSTDFITHKIPQVGYTFPRSPCRLPCPGRHLRRWTAPCRHLHWSAPCRSLRRCALPLRRRR